jgi:hypothetical protein
MQLSNPLDKIEVIGVGLNQVVGGFEYWNVRKRCQRGEEGRGKDTRLFIDRALFDFCSYLI